MTHICLPTLSYHIKCCNFSLESFSQFLDGSVFRLDPDQLLKLSERWWLMHVGYCEVYSYSFRLFFDAWSESSWNVHSRWTKVPQQSKSKVANVPRNESSTGTKVPSVDFLLTGMKVQRNEKTVICYTCPHPKPHFCSRGPDSSSAVANSQKISLLHL